MAVGKLTALAVLCLAVVLSLAPADGAFMHRRSIDDDNSKTECENNTPCGWAVYTPFTRSVNYFMQNTCACPEGKNCIRTDDDITVSAFVYRCRFPSSSHKGS